MKAWDIPASAKRKRVDQALAARLTSPAGLLKLYQVYNAPGQGKMVFDTDFGPNLNEPSPERYGRGYVAYWETPNLRMASNIRDTLGVQPGMRMLVIVVRGRCCSDRCVVADLNGAFALQPTRHPCEYRAY